MGMNIFEILDNFTRFESEQVESRGEQIDQIEQTTDRELNTREEQSTPEE